MDVYKTWQGWSTHGPAHAWRCFGQIRPGADPGGGGGGKIGNGGPLLQETSSSDQKATATNQIDSNDLEACGKKCCYFWFHSKVKFLTRIWRPFWLSHFCVYLCNFNRFLCSKELYYPRATRCGGDIVTLLWFRPCVRACVCPSRFDLVNTIETEPLCASSSNLADMFNMTRGWTLLILEVRGQRSRSQLTYMEISLWTR